MRWIKDTRLSYPRLSGIIFLLFLIGCAASMNGTESQADESQAGKQRVQGEGAPPVTSFPEPPNRNSI